MIKTTESESDYGNKLWFLDLKELNNDELIRMYNMIKFEDYEFAKNAWYIPLEKDQRCPIMIAKGYHTPDTPKKIIEFEEIAEILEKKFRNFIDAWDLGQVTKLDVSTSILQILESRNIKVLENS
jgi:hypothetical protein